ncbi:helix-turn-helix transcriptional regulator [Jonesia quinghaiensis]|uniref:helix-turn-helix transcriptional regulator n=1 Tax=Jonesia quinghaiensis TaxID=262806 RepID=UPI00041D1334|nr:winged helix-turn-helix transcriptional regulator [Jonesia quinghaiensis]
MTNISLRGDMPNEATTGIVKDTPTTTAAVDEESTRERVLQLIVSDGPINAAALARLLGLTAAGVRRHLAQLEDDGDIAVHSDAPTGRTRGRPSRRYVATDKAHVKMGGGYSGIATDALKFLEEVAGPDAVEQFAANRLAHLEERYAQVLTSPDPRERVEQLAKALTQDGFAASVRPVNGIPMLQLCQGHCPVQHVAEQFPQLCEAEAKAFSRLLGVHTQRLVTLAGGGHVCTTNVPVAIPQRNQ